jgi:hypothetical protein
MQTKYYFNRRLLKIMGLFKYTWTSPDVIECRRAGGVRQTEIQTQEPFVPEPSISEVEVAIGKLKRYKPPGADQIPAETFQAGRGRGGEYCFLRSSDLSS